MGSLLAVLCAVIAPAKDLISKKLASEIDGTTSTFASFAFALPFYVLVLAILGLLGRETFLWSGAFLLLVLLRSVTDTLAEGLKMHAFAHGDISLVATFFSLSPLFLLITSPLITGDPLSWTRTLAIILVVGGSVLLVYHPSARGWGEQKKGILLATGAALFFSLNSCFDRLAVQKGTPVFAGFTMTLLSATFLLPWVIGRADRLRALWNYQSELWLRGLLEIAFMVTKLFALQFIQAVDMANFQRISLILSIIGGKVFFREQDFGRRLAAGLLIVAGVILTGWLQFIEAPVE